MHLFNPERDEDSLNELALCAGTAMLSVGVRIAVPNLRTVCYVERESYAASTLVARMEDQTLDSAPVWDDLKTFDGRPWRGSVDLVTAGIPCQGNSLAGKRLLGDDPRNLWPDTRRILREVGPEWFFLENVPGILVPDRRHGREAPIVRVLGELAEDGWDAEWDVFSAEEVGASQRRERVFLLAHSTRSRGGAVHAGQRQWNAASDTDRRRLQLADPERKRWGQGPVQVRTGQPEPGQCGEALAETPSAIVPNEKESLEKWAARRAEIKATGKNGNGMVMPLTVAARMFTLPEASTRSTPLARDGRSGAMSPSNMGRHSLPLPQQAAIFSSPQDQATPTGQPSSNETPLLNPRFVEWLMGWPPGWTDCASAVTGWSLWLQHSRSSLFTDAYSEFEKGSA